ncbi:hypothetical protein GF314_02080 [bacterium]|nr:hypothetical protein [bacterium]
MRRSRTPWPLAIVAGLVLAAGLTGCSDDADPTSPDAVAPALPAPEQLTFDFSFFAQGEQLDTDKEAGEYSHFVNAYLRAALLDLMAHLVISPPVAAFSLALDTPPSLQDDGSWVWVYTHVDGDEEAEIRLQGWPRDVGVDWELRVTYDDVDGVVWFDGHTEQEAQVGSWTFYEVEDPAHPATGRIAWDAASATERLLFTVMTGEDAGDTLEFRDHGAHAEIEHVDVTEQQTSTIRWYPDGHGWIRWSDYDGFQRSCWDVDLRNTECE